MYLFEKMGLGNLSTYRTQIMGIAAIMIVLCHAPYYGVEMPSMLRAVIGSGGLGVDIFLFVSGLGCYYSLKCHKDLSWGSWYKKRFVRIFIPYALMQIPIWAYYIVTADFDVTRNLCIFSTVTFWTEHVGAWYVALLLPLYLITPPLYIFLQKVGIHRFKVSIILVVALITVCYLDSGGVDGVLHEIQKNLQWAFKRSASFILGMAIAPYIQENRKVNPILVILMAVILFFGVHRMISRDIFMDWCKVPVLLIFILLILNWANKYKKPYSFITWMGTASLESYLANIYLCGVMRNLASGLGDLPILNGKYLEYSGVIIFGLFLTYYVNCLYSRLKNALKI